jgi:uncharacterized membrane protein (Fun14 family)
MNQAARPHAEPTRWNRAPTEFARHVSTMPRWHKLVVALGVALLIAGVIGRVVSGSRAARRPAAPAVPADPSARTSAPNKSFVPPNASGFVNADTASSASPDRPMTSTAAGSSPTTAVPDDWLSMLSPHATKVGGSVLAGFVIGWLFRAFLKTMALLALIAFGGLFALSYFGVIQVDLVAIRAHYADAAAWVFAQGEKVKDAIVAHLPSAGAGGLGAFLGFRRR